MSNNGHDAEARGWLRLIFLTVLEGLLLATMALKHWVISKLTIDHFAFEAWLFKSLFLASETMIAIGTLAAIFKLLFVSNRTNFKRRSPPPLPWWCGR